MKGRAEIEFGLLGALIAAPDGSPVRITSARQRSILGILLTNLNEDVVTDRLIENVWEGRPPKSARAALQVHMSHLRKAVGRELIATSPNGYRIELSTTALDVTVYEELYDQARSVVADDPAKAISLLEEARGLWRGNPLLDFAYEGWAQPEIRRLEALRLEAMAELFEARLARGERGIAAEIELVLVEDPYRERLQGLYARALYREGRQTAAVRSLDEARERLRAEFGLDLSPELRDLEQRLLEQSSDLDVAPTSGRLPTATTSFVGRQAELTALANKLDESRVVTVVGPGGVGKSRLVLEEASRLSTLGTDVRWVELAAVDSPDVVDRQALQSVGIRESPGHTARDSLALGIGDRELVLVLDAAEQLLASVADLVAMLLEHCPRLRILVTSRERLRVTEESVLPLDPLPVADEADGAVELLLDRIRSLNPVIPDGEVDRSQLSRLCAALDGLPLAIEIVATRVSDLGVAKVLHEIHLIPETLRIPDRLLATIGFSYELLGKDSKQLFELLSVFMGSFDLEAARYVAEVIGLEPRGVLDSLSLLVDKSLLTVESTAIGRRYRMLDTIKAFAADRLNGRKREEAQDGHASYYLQLGIQLGGSLRGGPGQAESLRLLDADLPNLVAAGRRASTKDPSLLLEAAWELLPYWIARSRSLSGYEFTVMGRGHLEEVKPRIAVNALVAEAWLAELARDQDVADRVARKALDLANAACPDLEYRALLAIAHANFNGKAPAIAVETGMRAGELAKRAGDDWIAGWAWMTAGTASYEVGDLKRSTPALEKALAILSELEDVNGTAWTIWCLGMAARHQGKPEEFEERMSDALAMFQRIDDGFGTTTAIWGLAEAALMRGDPGRARVLYRRSLDHELEALPTDNEAAVFGRLATIALEERNPDEARSLIAEGAGTLPESSAWAAAELCLPLTRWALDKDDGARVAPVVFAALSHFEERGLKWAPDIRKRWDEVLGELEADLGATGVEAARSTSAEMTEHEVVLWLRSELG